MHILLYNTLKQNNSKLRDSPSRPGLKHFPDLCNNFWQSPAMRGVCGLSILGTRASLPQKTIHESTPLVASHGIGISFVSALVTKIGWLSKPWRCSASSVGPCICKSAKDFQLKYVKSLTTCVLTFCCGEFINQKKNNCFGAHFDLHYRAKWYIYIHTKMTFLFASLDAWDRLPTRSQNLSHGPDLPAVWPGPKPQTVELSTRTDGPTKTNGEVWLIHANSIIFWKQKCFFLTAKNAFVLFFGHKVKIFGTTPRSLPARVVGILKKFELLIFFTPYFHRCTWEGGRRKVGMGRSVKDKFKSCLAVNSSCWKSFFHYSRRQSRGPHEDWDQIWHRPLGAATRSVVQIWYWRYQIWLAPRKQASPT